MKLSNEFLYNNLLRLYILYIFMKILFIEVVIYLNIIKLFIFIIHMNNVHKLSHLINKDF